MRHLILALFIALAPALAQAQPPLTEVETLKLERAALLQQVRTILAEQQQWKQMFAQCTAALAPFELKAQDEANRDYLNEVLAQIHSTRPGFTLDLATGQFTPTPK